MPKRNANRRRKSSRKNRAQSQDNWKQTQVAYHEQLQYNDTIYADGDVIATARFSEDSIRRQFGYMMPVPPPQAGVRPWYQIGCWYTYTHPVTFEDIVVWVDGRYANGYAGEEEYYNGEKESAYYQDTRRSSSPPRYSYREGYHDPILKDQTEDWWRLFGHDVPVQFILAPVEAPEAEIERLGDESREEDSVVDQFSPQYMQFELRKKMEGEWDAAAYFAPYRTPKTESCPGVETTSCARAESEQSRWEDADRDEVGIATAEAVDRIVRNAEEGMIGSVTSVE